MSYEDMLQKAMDELPESVKKTERFNIPKVRGHIQGNKTIISNFSQIASVFRRDENHVLKFILKELATPGEIKKKALIIGSKVSAKQINEKMQKYADTFVTCRECGKPDTKVIKKDRITFIKCTACGARYPINA